MLHIVIDVLQR